MKIRWYTLFQDAIDAALPKFLAHGTYNEEDLVAMPRVGHYAIARTLKSEVGKRNIYNLLWVICYMIWQGCKQSLLAHGLVSLLVFTNPFALGVQRVRLELVTQMIDVLDLERERLI